MKSKLFPYVVVAGMISTLVLIVWVKWSIWSAVHPDASWWLFILDK